MKGLKLYPGYEPFYPHDPRLRLVYDLAEEFSVPVMIHSGDTFSPNGKVKYSHPLQVDEVAVDHRNVNFVICHLGNPWLVDYMEEQIAEVLLYAGEPNFLLYGTDWPICSMKSYLDFVRQLKLTDEDRHKIMYEGARKLFKLDHLPEIAAPKTDSPAPPVVRR